MPDEIAPDEAAPDEPAVDATEIGQAVASCVASQRSLVDDLRSRSAVEPQDPSRLPNWTVGHVLTHIARNADSIISMLDGHDQYPHGREGRNADIETGARRGWAELVDDVEMTVRIVDSRLGGVDDWGGPAAMIGGARPKSMVPLLRQREVEVHRTDLGIGYEFEDMPADYVRRDLRMMEMMWAARRPMGMTTLPDAALYVEPAQRLAWLMGRREIDRLAPAGLF